MMMNEILGSLILAQTRVSQIADQYRDESMASSGSLWILMVPVVAIGLGVAIYYWHGRTPVPVDTPEALVYDLCREHGLPRASRTLILRIARATQMPQPATMFLSIEHFENVINSCTKRIEFADRDQAQLSIIRRRIFAG